MAISSGLVVTRHLERSALGDHDGDGLERIAFKLACVVATLTQACACSVLERLGKALLRCDEDILGDVLCEVGIANDPIRRCPRRRGTPSGRTPRSRSMLAALHLSRRATRSRRCPSPLKHRGPSFCDSDSKRGNTRPRDFVSGARADQGHPQAPPETPSATMNEFQQRRSPTEASMGSIDQEMVLAHFIVSADVERSRRFYTEVLGGKDRDLGRVG